MRNLPWLAGMAVALALAGCAAPQEAESTDPDAASAGETKVFMPDDVAWQEAPPSLPEGARVAVLSGDPAAEGLFTMRVEMPPGSSIPYHTHVASEHVTVISGTPSLTFDEQGEARSLPPGSFFVIAPGTVHTFATGDASVVVQLHGEGPWGIAYEDPADAPRGA